MPRPRISEEIVERVKRLWAEDISQSALAVHVKYCQRFRRDEVSHRKVQQIIADAKQSAPKGAFTLVEWTAWTDDLETPVVSAYLLRLDAACLAVLNRHLYHHEAKWAKRLSDALVGLSTWGQLLIIQEYARRESIAFMLANAPYTVDLNALVAYRPWLSDFYEVYHWAVATNNAPALIGTSFAGQVDGEAYWEMVFGAKADSALPTLNRYGLSSSLSYITGLEFEPPIPLGNDTSQPNSGESVEVKNWLRVKLTEFWAGRSHSSKHRRSRGGDRERKRPKKGRQ